jgi:hypothetical protein
MLHELFEYVHSILKRKLVESKIFYLFIQTNQLNTKNIHREYFIFIYV